MKDVLFNVYTKRGARVTIVPVALWEALRIRMRMQVSKNKALHGGVVVMSGYFWEPPALEFDPNFDISEAFNLR